MWGLAHLWPFDGDAAFIAHKVQTFDFALIGLGIFHLTMVVTVAIGCVVVMIMKGPQYTSDSYELQDADKPAAESTAKPTAKPNSNDH